MTTDFVKKNWLYITLFCFIVALNVLPHFKGKPPVESNVLVEAQASPEEKSLESMFINFEEARRRSAKIESILKENVPLFLFYTSFNLSIFVIFFLGLGIDGYFANAAFRKKEIFRKTPGAIPAAWNMGEVFKIIILAFALTYFFLMVFVFFTGILESAMGVKFVFYKNENFKMIFDTIVLDFCIFLTIAGLLLNVHKKKFASFGFVKKNALRNIFYGIAGYIGIIPVILIIGIVTYAILNVFGLKPPPQPIVGLFLAEKNAVLVIASGVIAAVFGPVVEEIFFRGVMYNAVKKKIGIFWAILITSALFSLLHTHAMSYFLVGFVPIMILGMVLAYLYEKTGSLIPSITLHILNNAGSVIMVFLFKYFNSLI